MAMKKEIKKASLLGRWKNREKKESAAMPISKAPKDIPIPLSGGQQRLFFLEQLYPKNPVYNTSEIYTFEGDLDLENLEKSLQAVFKTNDILRCSFHLHNGKPIQKVEKNATLNIEKFDLGNLSQEEKERRKEEIIIADSLSHFELENAPLMRATIIKLDARKHILFVTMHHIVMDKWSLGIFKEELAEFYKNPPSESKNVEIEPKMQFTDYAYWEQKRDIDAYQLKYWREKLSGDIPFLDLPTDRTLPNQPSFKGGSHVQYFSKELSNKVLELSNRIETTPYVLLLSAYYLLLYKYTGQRDILIGSPISVRNSKVLENVFGFFDETIVLRTGLSPSMSFVEFVAKVKKTTFEAFNNMDVSFDVLVKELKPERSLSSNPFFRTMFIYHAVPPTPSFGEGIEVTHTFYNKEIAKFDLTQYIANEDGILFSEFEYAKDLFDEDTIARFQQHYRILLEGIIADPDMAISKIQMLTQKEREFFLPEKTEADGPYHGYSSIHQIIEDIGSKQPNSIALSFSNSSKTYGELMKESDQLAKRILNYSQGNNEIVGLCVDRSVEMIVGLLAILKSGCAYLPIDPEYPSQRIAFMLEDSRVPLVLTQKEQLSNFEGFKGIKLLLENEAESIENFKGFPEVGKTDLAYVIYTSGSTGKPKGVPITHGNIINSTEGRLTFYPENPTAFLLMSSIAFDSSKAGVFWTLCTGGTLVISEKRLEQDIDKLSEVIERNSVSHTLMLPTLYKMLLEYSDLSKIQSLTTVMVAGEACPVSLCEFHFKKLPKVSLYNEYGPTEATVWCIAHQIKKDNLGDVVPIGKSVAGAEVYLLNESHDLVPLGAIGEIYIGGPGLAGSYLNRPELTDHAYINHPFEQGGEKKLYKTGDLGRYGKDGSIEFLGRADQQVKIRGFRIELDEIEKVVTQHSMAESAVVMIKESSETIDIDVAKLTDSNEISSYLERFLGDKEAEELIDYVQSLKEEEKTYWLEQIQ